MGTIRVMVVGEGAPRGPAGEFRYATRPSAELVRELVSAGDLVGEADVAVPDGLVGRGLAAALCADTMSRVCGGGAPRTRRAYVDLGSGDVLVDRLARLDVDPDPVATIAPAEVPPTRAGATRRAA